MKKRMIALLTVIVLVVTCFAGCGKGSGRKTIYWAIIGEGCEDQSIVLDEFNERLQEYLPGFEVEFVNVWNLSNMLSSGEQVDITWTGYARDVVSDTEKDAYIQLDDLVEEYGTNIKQEMKDYPVAYESGTYKGKLYMIPNQQPLIQESCKLIVPYELEKYMDIDALLQASHASAKTTKEVYDIMEDYFEKITAAGVVNTNTVGTSCDINAIFETIATRGYDFVGGMKGAWMCYDTTVDNPEIVNFFDTDEFKTFMEYAGRWYEKGYISENALVTGGSSGGRASTLSAHPTSNWYGTQNEQTGQARGVVYDFDQDGNITYSNVLMDVAENKFQGVNEYGSEASYCAIPHSAKYPEEAMQLLDLLRAPKGEPGNELLNLLVYGFEKNSEEAAETGHHYTLEGDLAKGVDYTIQPDNSCKYGIAHWVIANVYLTYRTPNILEGQQEYAYEWVSEKQQTYRKTKLYNFRGDLSEFTTQIGNVQAAITEFKDQLVYGTKGTNYTDTYNQMMEKIQAADIATIKNELNKQAQDYMSK